VCGGKLSGIKCPRFMGVYFSLGECPEGGIAGVGVRIAMENWRGYDLGHTG